MTARQEHSSQMKQFKSVGHPFYLLLGKQATMATAIEVTVTWLWLESSQPVSAMRNSSGILLQLTFEHNLHYHEKDRLGY